MGKWDGFLVSFYDAAAFVPFQYSGRFQFIFSGMCVLCGYFVSDDAYYRRKSVMGAKNASGSVVCSAGLYLKCRRFFDRQFFSVGANGNPDYVGLYVLLFKGRRWRRAGCHALEQFVNKQIQSFRKSRETAAVRKIHTVDNMVFLIHAVIYE